MIMKFLWRTIFSGMLALALAGLVDSTIFASDHLPPSSPHKITLNGPHPVEMGQTFILSGTIEDLDGNPLENKSIFFSINGEYLGQTPSDKKGNFSREFKKSLDAGIYKITAETNREYLSHEGSPSIYLSVLPTQVVIQITPPIPDVGFMMDGRKFYTDQEGIATIRINKNGTYRLSVLDDEYEHPTQRIELGRWTEEIYQPYQDISVPTKRVIQVGINVFQIFSMDFVDLEGEKVDPSRVSEFT
ncbi:MAG TPA: hypothetical protein VK856_15375, partial [Anaerolineaceae bacterium]|nr:hypothetical protein [Anaerolineaceae bacterium]